MPTHEQLQEYVKQLPEIYRDILAAFPEIEPFRKKGYGLAFQTIAIHFANRGVGYGFDEVKLACEELAKAGFFEIKHQIFAHPTELGEQLIAMVSGKAAPVLELPKLPTPTWAVGS